MKKRIVIEGWSCDSLRSILPKKDLDCYNWMITDIPISKIFGCCNEREQRGCEQCYARRVRLTLNCEIEEIKEGK